MKTPIFLLMHAVLSNTSPSSATCRHQTPKGCQAQTFRKSINAFNTIVCQHSGQHRVLVLESYCSCRVTGFTREPLERHTRKQALFNHGYGQQPKLKLHKNSLTAKRPNYGSTVIAHQAVGPSKFSTWTTACPFPWAIEYVSARETSVLNKLIQRNRM